MHVTQIEVCHIISALVTIRCGSCTVNRTETFEAINVANWSLDFYMHAMCLQFLKIYDNRK